MMSRTGRIIQIDRLIFDTRNKSKRNSISSNLSSSLVKTNESYIFIPSDKIKIIRLTHENLNSDLLKLSTIDSQSPQIIKSMNDEILSPIYESIDERRNSIEKKSQLETLC